MSNSLHNDFTAFKCAISDAVISRLLVLFSIKYCFCDAVLYEPAYNETCNKTCATSEDSDQPAHPRSLIRVFADRMCQLQAPGYPER